MSDKYRQDAIQRAMNLIPFSLREAFDGDHGNDVDPLHLVADYIESLQRRVRDHEDDRRQV